MRNEFAKRMLVRWLAYVGVACTLVLAVFAYYEYREFRSQLTRTQAQIDFALDAQARRVREVVDRIVGSARHLARIEPVRRALEQADNSEFELATASLLGVAGSDAAILQLRVLDAGGRERVRINQNGAGMSIVPDTELQDKSARYYVRHGLDLAVGQVYLSPIDLNVEHGRIEVPHRSVFRVVAPVLAGAKKLGLVVLNYDATALIAGFSQAGVTAPGQVMMIDSRGVWQLAPDPADAWADQLGHERRFSLRHPAAWAVIGQRQGGQVRDEAGLFSFRAVTIDINGARAVIGAPRMTTLAVLLPAHRLHWSPWGVAWRNRDELLGTLLISAALCLLVAWMREEILGRRRERREHLRRLRLAGVIFDNTGEALVVTDPDLRVIAVNPATARVTGYSEGEIIGRTPALWASGEHDRHFYQKMWARLRRDGHWQGELVNRRKNGELFTVWENISAVRDGNAQVSYYVSIMSDISEIKHARAQLEHLAYNDPLTLLPNRLLLQNNLRQMCEIGKRESSHFAVAIMDLDNFKVVNDSLGHEAGDDLLKVVAERLREQSRSEDTVARLGGDEFAMLLPGMRQADEATLVIERLLQALAAPAVIGGREIRPHASIGIALFPEDACEPGELVRAADAAMYEAKKRPQSSFAFHHPELDRRARHRMELEHALRHALRHEEFELHYQPQLELDSGRIVSAEALLRWRHPEQGLISAAEFIPVAEESGLIDEIGHWVIRRACRQIREWRRQGLPPLRIAVNVSGHQLNCREIRDHLFDALAEFGLKQEPGLVELEVTESMLMREPQMIDLLGEFRKRGVSLALDDFGTGYSSLGQLRRLPVNRLKIAGEFVRHMHADAESHAIVRTIVRLAHEMDMRVLAEEVERSGQRDLLVRMGCDEIQGFLIAKALPPAEFADLIRPASDDAGQRLSDAG